MYVCLYVCMYQFGCIYENHGKYRESNLHTYKHTYLLIEVTIQTCRHCRGRKTMYVKPYLHDIYHGFRTKHTYIHFNFGTFFSYIHFRNHGKYHANWENHQKNIKNELLRGHVCMEEYGKYASKVGQTSKVHFDVTTFWHPKLVCMFQKRR